jgi:F-type H+-transporting ATPase subunit a
MSEEINNIEEAEGGESHSIHVPPLKPEILFDLGPVHVTNAMFSSLIITILIIAFVSYLKKRITLIPSRIQIIAEMIVNMFYEKFADIYQDRTLARRHTAIIASFFIFIFITNLLPMMPIISSLKWNHELHLARPATSHYAFTLALAMLSLFIAHLIGLMHNKLGHINKFIRFEAVLKIRKLKEIPNAIFEIFFGLLEVIGEFSKVLSLASRLFGNLIAHEIVIAVIMGISVYTQFVAPVPFYIMGFIVAFIQATVFSLLSMNILMSHVKSH